MNREQVIALMKKQQGNRNAKEYAAELGISAPYLSDIYLGKRDPGPAILERFGLRSIRKVEFERIA